MTPHRRPRSGTLLPLIALVVATLLPIGCGSDSGDDRGEKTPTGQAPARVVATILIAQNQLTLIGLRAASADALPEPRQRDPKLAWRYESEAGEILAHGEITNPLLVTSEFDQSGVASPKTMTAKAAVIEIALPNTGGIFVLSDPAGSGQTQSWDSIKEALKVFIQKLVDVFKFGSNGSGGSGGTSAGSGGASSGGVGAASGAGGAAGGSAGTASGAEEVVKPSAGCKAFSLLFAAEGYTEAERGKFDADVKSVIGALSSTAGYADNWKYMSVWQKFFASQESGIGDIGTGLERDTAFRVQHAFDPNDPDIYRSIWMGDDVPAQTLADLAAAKADSSADVVLVLANTSEIGGSASAEQRIGFFTTDAELGPTAGHELGHALFGLEDEYEYGACDPAAYEPLGPNVALGNPYPWASMMTKGINIPTVDPDPNVVGAYKGGLYCTEGVYRPQMTCFMRELSAGFCKVCAAHIDKTFIARTAACQPKGTCAHSECAAGSALDESCSACTSSVCATHPECCDPAESWSAACVEAARDIVGACRGICFDNKSSCSHDECAEGASLTTSCSTCAKSICERDPYCCSGDWDSICAKEAKEDPYCSCPGS